MPDCVVNASPLIMLGRVGRIDLLGKLFDSVVIPQGVADEVLARRSTDAFLRLNRLSTAERN